MLTPCLFCASRARPCLQITVRGVRFVDVVEEPSSPDAKPFLAAMDVMGYNYEVECYALQEDATFEHGRAEGSDLLVPRLARGMDLLFWRCVLIVRLVWCRASVLCSGADVSQVIRLLTSRSTPFGQSTSYGTRGTVGVVL